MQERLQKQMAEMTIEATAGGGMVTVVVNGHKNLLQRQARSRGRVERRRRDAAGSDRGRDQRRAPQGGRGAGRSDAGHDGRHEDSRAVLMARSIRWPISSRRSSVCPASAPEAPSGSRTTCSRRRARKSTRCAPRCSPSRSASPTARSAATSPTSIRASTAPRPIATAASSASSSSRRTSAAIEKTRGFRGRYHVLMGAIAPLQGIGPDDLKIKGLLARVAAGGVEEVILATNPPSRAKRRRSISRGSSSRSVRASPASPWACRSAATSTTRTSSRCRRRWKDGGRCK